MVRIRFAVICILVQLALGWNCGGSLDLAQRGPHLRRSLLDRETSLGPIRIEFLSQGVDLGDPIVNFDFQNNDIQAVQSFFAQHLQVYQVTNFAMSSYSCGDIDVP